MAKIIFPNSTSPGKDRIEGGGRLINCYAEPLPEGAPAPYVIRRGPGLTTFAETANAGFRSLWYNGTDALYVAYSATLAWLDQAGNETAIGGIPDGAIAFNGRTESLSDLSSYTLAALPLGDADADRRIVVGVTATEYESAELVTNGTFNTNLTGWSAVGVSWQAGGGNGYAGTTGIGTLAQTLTLVAGATYRINISPRGIGPGLVDLTVNGATIKSIDYPPSAVAAFHYIPTQTSNVFQFLFSGFGSGFVGIDDVSVKRVQLALPTAVSIGGVGATNTVSATHAALWIANVPTGTTGDVVLTYANTMNSTAIGLWRLGGVTSNTPTDTASGSGAPPTVDLTVPFGGVAIAVARMANVASFSATGMDVNFNQAIDSFATNAHAAASGFFSDDDTVTFSAGGETVWVAAAVWQGSVLALGNGAVTFAKNNATTPDQVMVAAGMSAVTFTKSAITPLSVNSEIVNSVCFGEAYFFFTTPGGLCYASGVNATTVSSLDVIRCEAKAEPLVRGVFFDGELYLFSETHTEVWASGGNPNATGFPLNRTTVIWRGLLAPLAVCGFDDGFESTLIWVADDNSVRQLRGYTPATISPPDLERAIAAVTAKSSIRCAVYDIDGHACVVIDLAGTSTWVYDLTTEWWHERESHDADDVVAGSHGHWRFTGPSVKAFGKWIGGDHHTGNLIYVDETEYGEIDASLPFIAESIAMEGFPTRLAISRADFNFVSGVGLAAVPDPVCLISWSDDGGHTWSDPVTRKLGENRKYKTQVRVNRAGLTGVKGRRWRVRIDDEVYAALLGGDMTVVGRS